MSDFAALILAGGAARRLGGAAKPALTVRGIPLLSRVLEATANAEPRIVVGPLELVPLLSKGASITLEQPPGGGPVAAIGAGLALLAPALPPLVGVFASDLPFLTASAVAQLRIAASTEAVDGSVLEDDRGRPQWLAGVWRTEALAAHLPPQLAGVSMRELLGGLRIGRVRPDGGRAPAWFDCDTEDDIRRAEEWADAG